MIGYLEGTVLSATEKDMIVLVSGVGYKTSCPLPLLLSKTKGDAVSLFVYTHVREDALILFGFEKEEELELFTKLISVSGVGPKSALSMLSVNSSASLAGAIERGDAQVISHTPGIGKKTAEKIIIELKGKLGHIQSNDSGELFDVRLALESLGYSSKEIHAALEKLDPTGKGTSTLIKEALLHIQ